MRVLKLTGKNDAVAPSWIELNSLNSIYNSFYVYGQNQSDLDVKILSDKVYAVISSKVNQSEFN